MSRLEERDGIVRHYEHLLPFRESRHVVPEKLGLALLPRPAEQLLVSQEEEEVPGSVLLYVAYPEVPGEAHPFEASVLPVITYQAVVRSSEPQDLAAVFEYGIIIYLQLVPGDLHGGDGAVLWIEYQGVVVSVAEKDVAISQ